MHLRADPLETVEAAAFVFNKLFKKTDVGDTLVQRGVKLISLLQRRHYISSTRATVLNSCSLAPTLEHVDGTWCRKQGKCLGEFLDRGQLRALQICVCVGGGERGFVALEIKRDCRGRSLQV